MEKIKMDTINQDTIEKIMTNFNQLKSQIEKIEGILTDLNNCKSEYTKTILVSASTKLAEQMGLKEKIFG